MLLPILATVWITLPLHRCALAGAMTPASAAPAAFVTAPSPHCEHCPPGDADDSRLKHFASVHRCGDLDANNPTSKALTIATTFDAFWWPLGGTFAGERFSITATSVCYGYAWRAAIPPPKVRLHLGKSVLLI